MSPMQKTAYSLNCLLAALLLGGGLLAGCARPAGKAQSHWVKYEHNPVLSGLEYGTVFDVCVLREQGKYRMWFSWRPKQSIGLTESDDGMHWNAPKVVFRPDPASGWEDMVNRPVVVRRGPRLYMWYTGQKQGRSWIGCAVSVDQGWTWQRMSRRPVLSAEEAWEKAAVMCPHVLWDDKMNLYRMWYSGGANFEPDAIGYAVSPDGLQWKKYAGNPIFRPSGKPWENIKVTGAQVIQTGGWHIMFYIGFGTQGIQICAARSRDGISHWERHPANPILSPGEGSWDGDACYKPYAVFSGRRWMLWYNGRRGQVEQIGLATQPGEDLHFDREEKRRTTAEH